MGVTNIFFTYGVLLALILVLWIGTKVLHRMQLKKQQSRAYSKDFYVKETLPMGLKGEVVALTYKDHTLLCFYDKAGSVSHVEKLPASNLKTARAPAYEKSA